MICVDDSEWMSFDTQRSRYYAQYDSINRICRSAFKRNPENVVGLVSIGRRMVVLPPTSDFSAIKHHIFRFKVQLLPRFAASIRAARLGLMHQMPARNPSKIVVFVGSPIDECMWELEEEAERVRGVNMAIDIISFEDDEDPAKVNKLKAVYDIVNSARPSNFLHVPCGIRARYEMLFSSPILGINGGASTSRHDSREDDDDGVVISVVDEQRACHDAQDDANGPQYSNEFIFLGPLGNQETQDDINFMYFDQLEDNVQYNWRLPDDCGPGSLINIFTFNMRLFQNLLDR